METKKKKSLASRIPGKVWLVISIVALLVVWYILSIIPQTARGFPNLVLTVQGLLKMIERGVFWQDISSSLISVFGGYALGFIIALPVAILMAWYIPVRNILNPWIQFIRNIPPLAYVPLIVIVAGVGRRPQIIVITIACFYHIADALQCSAGCILRGYRITLMPMIVQTVCLCGLGLTIGAWLAGFFPWSTMRWGGVSFWYGAATGLTAAAALLVPYALRTARRFAEKPRAA